MPKIAPKAVNGSERAKTAPNKKGAKKLVLKSSPLVTSPSSAPKSEKVATPSGRPSKAAKREGLLNVQMVSKPFRITPSCELAIAGFILEKKRVGEKCSFQEFFEEALADCLEKHGLTKELKRLERMRARQRTSVNP